MKRKSKVENIGLGVLIPANKKLPQWVVIVNHYWGMAPTLEKACKNAADAGAGDGQMQVVVCRCDKDAYVNDFNGNLHTRSRSAVYRGIVLSLRKARFGKMEKIEEEKIN